jgi:hypothetical protein
MNEDAMRPLLVKAEAQRARAGAVLGGGVVRLWCGERGQDGRR